MNAQNHHRITLLFGWIAFVLGSSSAAQVSGTAIITGQISNAATHAYLEGALVELVGTNRSGTTDREGRYFITGVSPNESGVLSVSYSGLDTQRVPVAVESGQKVVRDVALNAAIYLLEKVTVAGEREGMAKAEVKQRQAPNRMNVLSSDAFGNIADGNIADMLQTAPGVTAGYDDLEVTGMSIRGVDGSLNSVTMDGLQLANSAPGRTRRSFEFDQQSLGNIESIEVTKAATPDMQGSSIGGSINLVTKSAFDRKMPRTFTYSLGLTHQEGTRYHPIRHSEPIPGYGMAGSFSYSDVLGEKKNLGIMVTGTTHSLMLTHYRALLSHESKDDPGPVYTYSASDAFKSQDSWRMAGGVKLDYRWSDQTTLTLGTSYFSMHKAISAALIQLATAQTLATVDANGNRTGGGVINPNYADGVTRVFAATNSLSTISDSTFNSAGSAIVVQPSVRHRWENMVINYGLSFSSSASSSDQSQKDPKFPSRPKGNVSLQLRNIGWNFDRRENPIFPAVTQTSGPSIFDLNNYGALQLDQTDQRTISRVLNGNFDLRRDLAFRLPTFVKTGLAYSKVERKFYGDRWRYNYTGPDGVLGTADDNQDLAQFMDRDSEHLSDAEYLRHFKFSQGMVPMINSYSVARHAATSPQFWKENVAFDVQQKLLADRNITETISGAYVMANVKLGPLAVLTGVRVEETRDKGDGPLTYISPEEKARRAAWGTAVVTDAEAQRRAEAEYGNRQTSEGKYRSVFPGIHLKYEPIRNLIGRVSWSTGIGRPDLGSIMPLDIVNDDAQTVNRRNTELKPQYADNYDLTVEYYFKSQGMFSAGVFRKDISDYIYSDNSQIIGIGPDNGFDGLYEGYRLTTSSNRGNSKIEGAEISFSQQLTFLPGWAKGFGVNTNFTWLRTEGNYGGSEGDIGARAPVEGFVLAGFLPKSGSLSLSYRGHNFDLRLQGVYRGPFMQAGSPTPALVQRRPSRTNVTFKSKYAISPRLGLFLDVENIAATPVAIIYRAYPDRMSAHYTFATKYVGGVTGSF